MDKKAIYLYDVLEMFFVVHRKRRRDDRAIVPTNIETEIGVEIGGIDS